MPFPCQTQENLERGLWALKREMKGAAHRGARRARSLTQPLLLRRGHRCPSGLALRDVSALTSARSGTLCVAEIKQRGIETCRLVQSRAPAVGAPDPEFLLFSQFRILPVND